MVESTSSIVLLHGNDDFLVEQAAREVLAARCPGAEAQGLLTTVRGDVDSTEAVLRVVRETLDSVQTLNMFGDRNATWLRGVTFLGGELFRSPEVKQAVERFQDTLARGLGPGQFLLITVAGKVDTRSRFLKALTPVAEIREFSRASGSEAEVKRESVERLRGLFQKTGIRCGEEALQELAARCQNDTRRMLNEVEKLDLYLGKRRELTREDVERMVGAPAETQVYLIGEAITQRNVGMAMRILQQMETQGQSHVMLMAILHNTLREMAFLRALLDQGAISVSGSSVSYRDPAAEQEFAQVAGDKKRSPWRQAQLARQSQQFSPAQLDNMVRLSADTYHRMFRSTLPPFELLRILVLRLCYASGRKAA